MQDFGKYPRMRTFIQEYIQALSAQNDGIAVAQRFVKRHVIALCLIDRVTTGFGKSWKTAKVMDKS